MRILARAAAAFLDEGEDDRAAGGLAMQRRRTPKRASRPDLNSDGCAAREITFGKPKGKSLPSRSSVISLQVRQDDGEGLRHAVELDDESAFGRHDIFQRHRP